MRHLVIWLLGSLVAVLSETALSETALSETALSETALSETALSETALSETLKVALTPYRSAEPVSEAWSSASSHLVILGALEKVNHELQPENSEVISGRRFQETFYLPEARRTEQVFDHYRTQLEGLGEILFECDGRSCGSSSYWANKVFEKSILYGPEQYQKYAVITRRDGEGYIAVYVGERATRKIYVHLVYFLRDD